MILYLSLSAGGIIISGSAVYQPEKNDDADDDVNYSNGYSDFDEINDVLNSDIHSVILSSGILLQVCFQNHRRHAKKKVAPAAAVQAPTAASTAVAPKHTLDHQESYRPVQAPTASSTAVAPKHTLDHQESYNPV